MHEVRNDGKFIVQGYRFAEVKRGRRDMNKWGFREIL
jgi:hypothetical protein